MHAHASFSFLHDDDINAFPCSSSGTHTQYIPTSLLRIIMKVLERDYCVCLLSLIFMVLTNDGGGIERGGIDPTTAPPHTS